jgi:hypothetical protein
MTENQAQLPGVDLRSDAGALARAAAAVAKAYKGQGNWETSIAKARAEAEALQERTWQASKLVQEASRADTTPAAQKVLLEAHEILANTRASQAYEAVSRAYAAARNIRAKSVDAAEVAAELAMVGREFGDLRLCNEGGDTWVCAVCGPFTFDGIPLGRFEVRLRLGELGDGNVTAHAFKARPLNPNPHAEDRNVTHPHVSGGTVCPGDAEDAITVALQQGRVGDAFLLVKSVLSTWDDESAYLPIETWLEGGGPSCPNCGDGYDRDNGYFCEVCEEEYCLDCGGICGACDCGICLSHKTSCDQCDSWFCMKCIQHDVDSDGFYCKDCLDHVLAEREAEEDTEEALAEEEEKAAEAAAGVAAEALESLGRAKIEAITFTDTDPVAVTWTTTPPQVFGATGAAAERVIQRLGNEGV